MLPALFYKTYKNNTYLQLKKYSELQWLDQKTQMKRCDQLTTDLALHCFNTVPYYKQLFGQLDLQPHELSSTSNWDKLPILEKHKLKHDYSSLMSNSSHTNNSYVCHTGGSTGQPVQFLTDMALYQRSVVWLDLVFSWCGWKPGELKLHFWGSQQPLVYPSLYTRWRSRLTGQYIIPVYSYEEKDLADWFRIIRLLRPTVLYGYPTVLNDLATWLNSGKYSVPKIKGVYTTAETLLPHQRTAIEKAFVCKVYNQYGSRETPGIACECPEGNMHLFTDMNRVEFLNENTDDSSEIIVTPLFNFAQPLLRYRIGDMGKKKNGCCSCGRGYPMMEITIARSRDLLFGLDGKKIHPGFFTRMMDNKSWVKSFQFRQTKKNTIQLFIVPEKSIEKQTATLKLQEELTPIIQSSLGEGMILQIHSVKHLDRTVAGKHRFVMNEIDLP